ncbi:alpha/beta-type small acid-soluble spore protein [Paenibacillus dakarensis]|uniref:alpha/beta-type small acid-soluble spore protein n=1 Tax=Paenibacillus dakarensis TaxID=1527293 RepID=UPI0006D5A1C9|nr:alpha/beta-type small acid-soluble spore protein [Paenibacillus dakarensis]
MARRNNKYAVPSAAQGIQAFKAKVMKNEGYTVDPNRPDDVKYEVARDLGIPLQQGSNRDLTTEAAGQIGGKIGGSMVREMIRLAQQELVDRETHK